MPTYVAVTLANRIVSTLKTGYVPKLGLQAGYLEFESYFLPPLCLVPCLDVVFSTQDRAQKTKPKVCEVCGL